MCVGVAGGEGGVRGGVVSGRSAYSFAHPHKTSDREEDVTT